MRDPGQGPKGPPNGPPPMDPKVIPFPVVPRGKQSVWLVSWSDDPLPDSKAFQLLINAGFHPHEALRFLNQHKAPPRSLLYDVHAAEYWAKNAPQPLASEFPDPVLEHPWVDFPAPSQASGFRGRPTQRGEPVVASVHPPTSPRPRRVPRLMDRFLLGFVSGASTAIGAITFVSGKPLASIGFILMACLATFYDIYKETPR